MIRARRISKLVGDAIKVNAFTQQLDLTNNYPFRLDLVAFKEQFFGDRDKKIHFTTVNLVKIVTLLVCILLMAKIDKL
ncbi:MAG: hypothetical protein HC903_27840 [Methylacidiphilales bacterium]|nr:hypothetical protein [Candidatus Methylacidiphilales bacterium]